MSVMSKNSGASQNSLLWETPWLIIVKLMGGSSIPAQKDCHCIMGLGQAHVHSALWWCNAQWNRPIPCAAGLVECFLCTFWVVCCAEAKTCMLVCCCNRMEGGLTHIQGFLRLSNDVGMFYPWNKSVPSIEPYWTPSKFWCYTMFTCLTPPWMSMKIYRNVLTHTLYSVSGVETNLTSPYHHYGKTLQYGTIIFWSCWYGEIWLEAIYRCHGKMGTP